MKAKQLGNNRSEALILVKSGAMLPNLNKKDTHASISNDTARSMQSFTQNYSFTHEPINLGQENTHANTKTYSSNIIMIKATASSSMLDRDHQKTKSYHSGTQKTFKSAKKRKQIKKSKATLTRTKTSIAANGFNDTKKSKKTRKPLQIEILAQDSSFKTPASRTPIAASTLTKSFIKSTIQTKQPTNLDHPQLLLPQNSVKGIRATITHSRSGNITPFLKTYSTVSNLPRYSSEHHLKSPAEIFRSASALRSREQEPLDDHMPLANFASPPKNGNSYAMTVLKTPSIADKKSSQPLLRQKTLAKKSVAELIKSPSHGYALHKQATSGKTTSYRYEMLDLSHSQRVVLRQKSDEDQCNYKQKNNLKQMRLNNKQGASNNNY